MALTVEDGTGLSTSNSYVDQTYFSTWASTRGHDISSYTEAQKERALRNGAIWLDAKRYKGVVRLTTQAMRFPRTALYDDEDREITGVPTKIKDAQCQLAWDSLNSSDQELDDAYSTNLKREQIGPLEFEYFENGNVEQEHPHVLRMLVGLLASSSGRAKLVRV